MTELDQQGKIQLFCCPLSRSGFGGSSGLPNPLLDFLDLDRFKEYWLPDKAACMSIRIQDRGRGPAWAMAVPALVSEGGEEQNSETIFAQTLHVWNIHLL